MSPAKVLRIPLSDLLIAFGRLLDFLNPSISNHHLRVAYIANELARTSGLPSSESTELLIASSMHDIGVFSSEEQKDALEFEVRDPRLHSERGYLLIKDHDLLPRVAQLVRHHHTCWAEGAGSASDGEAVPLGAHLLHLADRIEVLIDKQGEILDQSERIVETIRSHSGATFVPELVDVFAELARRESFWFDLTSPAIAEIISSRAWLPDLNVDIDGLLSLSRVFANVIDFRSPFTRVHSAGVSAVAAELARLVGFTELECKMARAAGNLHDLGKLAVPRAILDQPSRLTPEQFNIVKAHVYHSFRILGCVRGMETINLWASLHHERMDGQGYPFKVRGAELPVGARVMGVADVFTAITEDRPYRPGMRPEEALRTIQEQARTGGLDPALVELVADHFDELVESRAEAQRLANEEYLSMQALLRAHPSERAAPALAAG